MKYNPLRRKWWFLGGTGASLFGFGICCVVESGFLKHGGAPVWKWVLLGTLSLIILITGVVLLIKAGFVGEQQIHTKQTND